MIFLDPASVHADYCRRHPAANPSRVTVAMNAHAFGPMFRIHDCSAVPDGVEVQASDPIVDTYHGLSVAIIRWARK